ncbi:uncharacterized protein RAG0_10291 [Rhynchosporium agropyri]|uniref:Uncharacterized protein n=1 Tax=Rhynchosporium agropyri TaxID=914238 RepID=A0A1E1KZ75_9HELO|nr:uncharacterized protein RAG0_10291 [Rhynchosporium agropyri]
MSQKSKWCDTFSGSSLTAAARLLSTPKKNYDPIHNAAESFDPQEQPEFENHLVSDPHAYRRLKRLLVLCIGFGSGCIIFSLLLLGISGLLLRNALNQSQRHDWQLAPNSDDEPWIPQNPDSSCLAFEASGSRGCGHTPTEAVAQGCIFDVMTTSWQHPDCYDEDLNAEIMALHAPWPFYWSSGPPNERPTAPEMLHLIPLEELGFYEGTFWATKEYHVWHCIYAWRQMHRAVEKGRKLDGFLRNYEHTAHCGRLIINATDHSGNGAGIAMESAVTRASIKYPLC